MAEAESQKARRARAAAFQVSRNWSSVPLSRRLGRRALTCQSAMMLASGSLTDGDVGPIVVEAGTIRTAGNWDGDGQSTVVWGRWVQVVGSGRVYSFDPDPAAIIEASRALAQFDIIHDVFDSAAEAHHAFEHPTAPLTVALVRAEAQGPDGVGSLFEPAINLLYLDAGDYVDGSLRTASAINCAVFLEARAKLERAGPWATVLIDDVNLGRGINEGKGHDTFAAMAAHGWYRYPLTVGHDYQGIATFGPPQVDPAARWGVPLA